ncbi:MAG: succinylglutamate desuccinylase/aspartoacylase family protein, partial [Saprospiraceae bacterium]
SAFYQNDEKPKVSELGRQMATHMGFDHLVIFQTTGKSYLEKENPSLYCSAEAFKRNIPAVDIECGRLGMIEDEFVDKIVVGVGSLLRHLKMTAGKAIQTEGIVVFPTRVGMKSNHTGFFYPIKSSGDYIKKGMKIGHITDFFNRVVEEIYAKESGVIMYMLGTPPVNKGETLVNIGIIEK